MQVHDIDLLAAAPGVRHRLRVWRFGQSGARPKAVIQAALHADEVPGVLVAHRLRERLEALEAAGELRGEVLLLPLANPLGLGQQLLGGHQGRFDFADGLNFNRAHPDLAADAADRLEGRLGDDAAANVAAVRAALAEAAAALPATTPAQDLKRRLVQQAIDADIVLDLHCDAEAVMHIYGLTPQRETAEQLGALLGAQAVLLATESGDSPFDEACSRPWLVLQQRFAPHPLPLGCFAATVELRGEADTAHPLARQDADALLDFLRCQGVLAGAPATLPAPLCVATPLAGSEPVTAPAAGVVVFHQAPGARVEAGTLIAELVDAETGQALPLRAQSAGVLYARNTSRWAWPGKRLAKIAGTSLARSGNLLSP
jgi:uncharacterized protein